ncbi:MAG: 4-hydroxythreonine-4-phosphate dehydrogenase PdxA [Elusimicrobia bacterium]|nr:4-hydroxythreonine-4-phosphate dehydrogenase PdxA [Elusimicrobiota bacterium]MBP9698599.1 4-hydroxythreonine-4-phosphate dehydrogenase PdxA [Elusimicrobiota bacterium]
MGKPFLAITTGDPAGCGPWVGARAALDKRVTRRARPVLVGDAWVVHRHFRKTPAQVAVLTNLSEYDPRPHRLNVLHVPHPHIASLILGKPQKVGGVSAALAVRTAVALAQIRRVAAVVTGPVSKESFKAAGLPFAGHTEMLAALSGSGPVEMLMTAKNLRALLVTRHIPLNAVSRQLTAKVLVNSVLRADRWIRSAWALRRPSWVVCGLNPHAGDNGLLGREEIRTVIPAVKILRKKGINAVGPFPADVTWAKHRAGAFDFVACLYHDQAMIPLKVAAAREVVNVTAGLSFIRTSPGHGTAFDLAQGRTPFLRADPEATVQACLTALRLADNFL